MTEFKVRKTHPGQMLAQTCCEHFAERLAEGTLKAESPSCIVSAFEEEQRDRL